MFRHRPFRPRRLVATLLASTSVVGALALPGAASSPPYTPPYSTTLTAADPIPVNGFGVSELAPVANAMRDYVKHRCAGAVTIGVSYKGTVLAEWGVGREHGRAASPILDSACGNNTTDPYDPSAPVADQYTPMRIGSVSKTMSAAVLRWSLKERYQQLTGDTLTDTELEAMPLLDNDFPGGLLPVDLRAWLAGETPLPDEIVECDDLDGVADPRWHDVTVGHLLAHRAGLQRSAPDTETKVVPNLPLLRGVDTPYELLVQDAAVRNNVDDTVAFDEAHSALQGNSADPVYFVPPPTLVEILKVVAGRCLEFESKGQTVTVGTFHYSNTDPAFWTVIMEHVTGVPFSGTIGDAASHEGSLLQQFFEQAVGLNSYGDVGVFRQAGTIDPDQPDSVPTPRHWTPSQNTLLPYDDDEKRPHCRLVAGVCSFDEWLDGTRANWNFELEQVPFHRAGMGVGAATGGLAITPRFMLAFMNEFRVGGYDANPTIGQPRNSWELAASHTGEMSGAHAVALSYSGNYDADYKVPPAAANGRLTDDLDHLVAGSFRPPHGLDVFVAVNQSTDPKCQASAAQGTAGTKQTGPVLKSNVKHYDCDTAYNLLDDYALYGLAQVDWDALTAEIDEGPAELNVPLGPGNHATLG